MTVAKLGEESVGDKEAAAWFGANATTGVATCP